MASGDRRKFHTIVCWTTAIDSTIRFQQCKAFSHGIRLTPVCFWIPLAVLRCGAEALIASVFWSVDHGEVSSHSCSMIFSAARSLSSQAVIWIRGFILVNLLRNASTDPHMNFGLLETGISLSRPSRTETHDSSPNRAILRAHPRSPCIGLSPRALNGPTSNCRFSRRIFLNP